MLRPDHTWSLRLESWVDLSTHVGVDSLRAQVDLSTRERGPCRHVVTWSLVEDGSTRVLVTWNTLTGGHSSGSNLGDFLLDFVNQA